MHSSITEYHNGPSNYVCAGCDCLGLFFNKFFKNYPGYLTHEKAQEFFKNNVDRFLFSFGTGLSYKSKKIPNRHQDKIQNEVKKIRSYPYLADSSLYIDSGGFQVAMGAINASDMPTFINMYDEFLHTNSELFNYAFVLDLPPAESESRSIFNSYADLENMNRMSYQRFAGFEQKLKDKMIFIYQFRSPALYEIWNKFIWEEDLANGFKNFSCGGLVANSATDQNVPFIVYSIPLADMVAYAKSKNLQKFNFHVLGGANYLDVFYHKLFTRHIKEVHNIDVTITYDSSAVFSALAVARFLPCFDLDDNLSRIDLRSSVLHRKFQKEVTVEQQLYRMMNDVATHYGFKEVNSNDDPIYCPNTKGSIVLSKKIYIYLICCYFRVYRELEMLSDRMVDKVYPLYKAGEYLEFTDICNEYSRMLNQDKISKKHKKKVVGIWKSLDIITNLDREYNKHMIDKYMSADDSAAMHVGGSLELF